MPGRIRTITIELQVEAQPEGYVIYAEDVDGYRFILDAESLAPFGNTAELVARWTRTLNRWRVAQRLGWYR